MFEDLAGRLGFTKSSEAPPPPATPEKNLETLDKKIKALETQSIEGNLNQGERKKLAELRYLRDIIEARIANTKDKHADPPEQE